MFLCYKSKLVSSSRSKIAIRSARPRRKRKNNRTCKPKASQCSLWGSFPLQPSTKLRVSEQIVAEVVTAFLCNVILVFLLSKKNRANLPFM